MAEATKKRMKNRFICGSAFEPQKRPPQRCPAQNSSFFNVFSSPNGSFKRDAHGGEPSKATVNDLKPSKDSKDFEKTRSCAAFAAKSLRNAFKKAPSRRLEDVESLQRSPKFIDFHRFSSIFLRLRLQHEPRGRCFYLIPETLGPERCSALPGQGQARHGL